MERIMLWVMGGEGWRPPFHLPSSQRKSKVELGTTQASRQPIFRTRAGVWAPGLATQVVWSTGTLIEYLAVLSTPSAAAAAGPLFKS